MPALSALLSQLAVNSVLCACLVVYLLRKFLRLQVFGFSVKPVGILSTRVFVLKCDRPILILRFITTHTALQSVRMS
jgi:hypothetical protein